MTDVRLAEIEVITTGLGHATMSPMPDSRGRAWSCNRCSARIYRLDGRLLGWASEYTCDAVAALHNNTPRSTP